MSIVAPERRQAKALVRLQRRIDKSGPRPAHRPELGPCWLWTGYRYPLGYGKFSVGTEQGYAHIWSFRLHIGPVPDGKELDHLCRNPSCVNPNHLEPVTHRENVLRGKSAHLTDADVLVIKSTPVVRGSGRRLAQRFNVSPALICFIRKGLRWKEVDYAAVP
jgi:hypothetical protein